MNTQKKPLVGYIAAFLNPDSHTILKAMKSLWTPFATHCTLAYNVKEGDSNEHWAQIGTEVTLEGYEFVQSNKVQVLRVRGIESSRSNLHVTVSCAQNIKPNEGSVLLESGAGEKEETRMQLKAVIRFIPFPIQPR